MASRNTPSQTGSTVPRRQLGRHLRRLRTEAGLGTKWTAGQLEISESTLWRIETGQTSVRSVDAAAMCSMYGASEDLTEALKGLAAESKTKGWWHSYGDVIPEGFDVYIDLEEAAETLDTYESELIPGLLQTPEYARAVMQLHNPSEGEEEINRRVDLRITRQTLLTRPTAPPTLRLVLNESILHRPVGGRAVMARQLAHLVWVAGLPNVMIRVTPFSAGLHAGVLSGPFVILRFPHNGSRESEPPTVYADGYTGSLYLDKQREIDRYDEAFKQIWQAALGEQESTRLLSDMAGNHEQQHQ